MKLVLLTAILVSFVSISQVKAEDCETLFDGNRSVSGKGGDAPKETKCKDADGNEIECSTTQK